MTALPLEPHTEADRRIADIEAAPYAPESAVERVALAIFVSDGYRPEVWDSEDLTEHSRNEYRANARAAIGAMKGPSPEAEALARVEALAEELDTQAIELWHAYKSAPPTDPCRANPHTEGLSDGYERAADGIRAALTAAAQPTDGRTGE